MRVCRIVLLILLTEVLIAQQPSSASLEGVVVRYESNEPLAGTTVELRLNSNVGVFTTTDRDGRFLIPNVQPGQYRLIASRSGYVRTEYGQSRPGVPQKPLAVRAGERLTGIRIVMTPGGLITGRIMRHGRPAAIVNVAAGIFSYTPDGQRIWKMVLSGVTNDLGEYSIFWLPPGRYYVMADMADAPRLPPPFVFINPGGGDNPLISLGNGGLVSMARGTGSSMGPVFSKSMRVVSDTEMSVPIFFPHTPDWQDATTIEIAPGSEVHNVDIDASPVPALHVRGTVVGAIRTNAQGQPVLPQIALFRSDTASTTPFANVVADPNGTFDFQRIKRGSYVLRSNDGSRYGRVPIEVRDRDINGVTLVLDPGVSISGRIVLDQPDIAVGNLTVELIDEKRSRSTARPAADGSFTMPNRLQNEKYRVYVSPIFLPLGFGQGVRQVQTPESISVAFQISSVPANLRVAPPIPPALQNAYVKSITMGTVDVLNEGLYLTEQPRQPLVITIGADAGSLEGRVVSSQQPRQPVAAATVVLIPEGGQRFHVNHNFAISDDSGGFRISRIPPGDYRLFAWESIEPGAWQNEDFVRGYESQGRLMHIDEGGRHSVELTSIP